MAHVSDKVNMATVVIASPGKFRVVEIDVRAATGFSGDPDDCARTISEHRSFARACGIARRSGIRFHRQVHDDRGRLLYYASEGTGRVPGETSGRKLLKRWKREQRARALLERRMRASRTCA